MTNGAARFDGPAAPLRLRVPPDPRYGKHVRERVADFAGSLHARPDATREFVTAVGEAFANAVEHARTDQPIEITCALEDEQFVATIVDAGIGLPNAESVAIGARLPDGLAERGRGMGIMQRCTDRFAIRSTPGGGTAVTLVRDLRRWGGTRHSHRAG